MNDDLLTPPIAAAASRTPWGRRWLRSVAGPADLASAVAKRARDIVRESRATALEIVPGAVRIRVRTHTGPVIHEVTATQWTAEQFAQVVDVFAGSVRRLGELASGRISDEIFDVLREREASLIDPVLERSASEEDIAALLLAASALDREPLWMFTLRQPDDANFLDLIRHARTPDAGDAQQDAAENAHAQRGPYEAGDLAALTVHPRAPQHPERFVDNLGPIPGDIDLGPVRMLVQDAATFAWQIAAGEGGDTADDTVLLAELRALRFATAAQLAEKLGRPTDEVAARLDALFATEDVLKTGQGDKARYRATAGN